MQKWLQIGKALWVLQDEHGRAWGVFVDSPNTFRVSGPDYDESIHDTMEEAQRTAEDEIVKRRDA